MHGQNRRYYILYPFSLVYGLIVGIRNMLYNKGILPSTEHNIPVICIGNLAVGGTGKTPHADYLITLLKPHYRVAVLSRGYKRKSKGFRIITALDTVSVAGDEPLQLALKHTDITVAVDRNRNNGIREIMRQRPETGVIIMDDGFQHRSVVPGKSVILSDYSNLYINDCLLPCGTLREHRYNIRRADIILITKTPHGINAMDMRIMFRNIGKYPYQNLYFTTLKYGSPVPVFPGEVAVSDTADDLKDAEILLITGIANPGPLVSHLNEICRTVRHARFPDHHNFTAEEISRLKPETMEDSSGRFYIFTTEKDAVRLRMIEGLPEWFVRGAYFIPVEVEFLNEDTKEFNNHIIDYVRKSKGNSRIPD
ncbi:MAG: tetraacyldisaccharide 4'-kinase [Bacteroidales bacterium]